MHSYQKTAKISIPVFHEEDVVLCTDCDEVPEMFYENVLDGDGEGLVLVYYLECSECEKKSISSTSLYRVLNHWDVINSGS